MAGINQCQSPNTFGELGKKAGKGIPSLMKNNNGNGRREQWAVTLCGHACALVKSKNKNGWAVVLASWLWQLHTLSLPFNPTTMVTRPPKWHVCAILLSLPPSCVTFPSGQGGPSGAMPGFCHLSDSLPSTLPTTFCLLPETLEEGGRRQCSDY